MSDGYRRLRGRKKHVGQRKRRYRSVHLNKYDVEAAEIQRIVKVDRIEDVLRSGKAVELFRVSTDFTFQVRNRT